MNKRSILWSVTAFVLLALAALALSGIGGGSSLQAATFDSEMATPSPPPPTPTPPMAEETQKALQHIAEREGVSIEPLVVVNQQRREYQSLGRIFWAVRVLDTQNDRWYDVLLDLDDGSFVDDVEPIAEAEQEAHRARYGKLEPALFERLETSNADDEVPVVIWVAGRPQRSTRELYAELAAKYPEAQTGMERSGNPFDAGDLELIHEIEAEYVRLVEADTQERVQPLADHLEKQGYVVTTLGALPAIAVSLPKAALLELVSRSDVGAVDLAGDEVKRQMNSAVHSERVPPVWQRGFEGSGIHIGILEPGKVDFTGPPGPGYENYLHKGAVKSCSQGVDDHKTLVASVAASYHSTYTGVAPEATIDDACTATSDVATIAGLEWATIRADPVNFSGNFNNDSGWHWTDKAFDHWARIANDTVVVGAGNFGDYVGSPGKGWNVLTVGAIHDKNDGSWANDTMWEESRWDNPTDTEKPEVVAVGAHLHTIGLNNVTVIVTGTSFAAPQVTGLAALLIDRETDLDSFPTAVRAIIMASAVHNIIGPSGMPSGTDLRDGAGAIDAILADEVARARSFSSTTPCDGPCWWGFAFDEGDLPEGSSLYRYFRASQGERIRAAVAWWSDVYCPDDINCDHDRLDVDLNMGAQYLDGSTWEWVPNAWSASYYNSHELVDFIAPLTGQYRIVVDNADSPITYDNQLGIAWVKDATYLPSLRNRDGDSGISRFYMCNYDAVTRDQYVYYFEADGAPTYKIKDQCTLAPNQCCIIPVHLLQRIPYGTTGSAIVSGGEDVVVAVVERDSQRIAAYTGLRPAEGDPNWENVGDDVYLPHVYRHLSWGYRSRLTILNSGSSSTYVDIIYRDQQGNVKYSDNNHLIGPNSLLAFSEPPSNVGTAFYGSAQVSSDTQPVAVVADALHDAGNVNFNYTALNGAEPVYLPYLMKNYSGWNSCFTVHNLSLSENNSVRVRYYWIGGSRLESYVIQPGGMLNLCQQNHPYLPDGPLSAKVWSVSGSGIPIAVAANQSHSSTGKHMSYSSFSQPTTTVILPHLAHNGSSGGRKWSSGIQIQNTGTSTTNPSITFYYMASTPKVGPISVGNIGAGRSVAVYVPNVTPNGFVGSAVVTADQPIVAVANATCVSTSCSGDVVYTYNGINR